MYLNVLGKSIVVLSSLKAARDLLEKKSANYSDRPRFVLLVELSVSHSPPALYLELRQLLAESVGTYLFTSHMETASGNTDV
jgi:hypothetical protein